jgi:WD40 repeat protein
MSRTVRLILAALLLVLLQLPAIVIADEGPQRVTNDRDKSPSFDANALRKQVEIKLDDARWLIGAFGHDDLIATGASDFGGEAALKIYSAKSGNEVGRYVLPKPMIVSLDFVNDGLLVVAIDTKSFDSAVYECRNKEVVPLHTASPPQLIEAASWRPKLGPIAVIAADDELIIQQLKNEKARATVELDRLFVWTSHSFSGDSSCCVLGLPNRQREIVLCSIVKHELPMLATGKKASEAECLSFVDARRDSAFALANDGRYLAVSGNNQVEVWDLKEQERTMRISGEDGERLPFHMSFSPDGKWFLESGSRRARLWEVKRSKLFYQFDISCRSAHFSPDSKQLLTIARSSNGNSPAAVWTIRQPSD